MATTEGALVASINRGASAINLSGGFDSIVLKKKMLRSPAFSFKNLQDAQLFSQWLIKQTEELRAYCKNFSKHATLSSISSDIVGKEVHSHFYYETGDASGQNMTTTCTWHSVLWIEEEFNKQYPESKIQEFILDSNTSSDKKVSYTSILNGRGTEVIADAIILESVLVSKLKTTSDDILRWMNRSQSANSLGGLVGYNVNIANVIAGMFCATGQDIACVHESSVGIFHVEKHEKGLYASIKLPRLVIGTVGGGTGLPGQKKILELSGCYGAGKVEKFAKVIAGFCLSLELSTMAAMVSGQFALAHERLGKNRPIKSFNPKEIFQIVTKDIFKTDLSGLTFEKVMRDKNGILTKMASENTSKPIGFSLWNLKSTESPVMIKSKAMDRDMLSSMYRLTTMIDPKLSRAFSKYQDQSEFKNAHVRECEIYKVLKKTDYQNIPKYYGSFHHAESETYLLAQEYLPDDKMKIINSEMTPNVWSSSDVDSAITAILKAQKLLKENVHQLPSVFKQDLSSTHSFATAALNSLKDEEIEPAVISMLENSLAWSKENTTHYSELETVVHNDFNLRNIAVSNEHEVKIYDWELATFQYPQRDIIEFCSFLPEKEATLHLQDHLKQLKTSMDHLGMDDAAWMTANRTSFCHYVNTRVNMYMLGHTLTDYTFLPLVLKNLVNFEKGLFKS